MSTINPYQSPIESEESRGTTGEPEDRMKTIGEMIVFWEKLRLAYNAVLGLLVIGFVAFSSTVSFLDPRFLTPLVFLAIAANLCFCAGPTVAAYMSWAGAGHRFVRGVSYLLFAVGMVIAGLMAVTVLMSF